MGIIRLFVIGMLLSFVCLVLLAFRPSVLIGVDGDSLGHSLGKADRSGVAAENPCRKQPSENWQCKTTDEGGNVSRYRVKVDAWGCWEAFRTNRKKLDRPRGLDGCVTLVNHLRLSNRLFGGSFE